MDWNIWLIISMFHYRLIFVVDFQTDFNNEFIGLFFVFFQERWLARRERLIVVCGLQLWTRGWSCLRGCVRVFSLGRRGRWRERNSCWDPVHVCAPLWINYWSCYLSPHSRCRAQRHFPVLPTSDFCWICILFIVYIQSN